MDGAGAVPAGRICSLLPGGFGHHSLRHYDRGAGCSAKRERRDLCGSRAHPGKHGPKLSAGLIQFACARAAVKRRKASGLQ